jgi:hypothetical protein
LSWSDRLGNNHSIENLGQNLCNAKNPEWQVDSGIFEDKNLLPVTKITYGGMEFESQKARVKLGALTCHPPENQYDLKKHLETLEQRTNDSIKKTNDQETKILFHENMINLHETKFDVLEKNNIKQTENVQSMSVQIEKITEHESRIKDLEEHATSGLGKMGT